MAVRLTWTNNSSGHDGTYVYRDTSPMDPQALPAPIADLPAAVEEYIDTGAAENAAHYYRTQDYEGGQVSAVSDEVYVFTGDDFSAAQIGDYIGGGVYAGQMTISGSDYHIVFSIQVGELSPSSGDTRWKTSQTATSGADSTDDGLANTNSIIAAGIDDHPAAKHCINYTDSDGNSDYYLPSSGEILLESNLRGHPELSEDTNTRRWSSTTSASNSAGSRNFSGFFANTVKDSTSLRVRPVRRVPV